jgi:hypothetical protein
MLRQQKTITFFNYWAFFNAVTHSHTLYAHSRVARQCNTPSLYNQGCSLLCAYARFQHSSLHCFGSNADLHNLVKINGVPWLVLSSVDMDLLLLVLSKTKRNECFYIAHEHIHLQEFIRISIIKNNGRFTNDNNETRHFVTTLSKPNFLKFHETRVDGISWNFMKSFMKIFMKFHEIWRIFFPEKSVMKFH